ncbi:MAG TPA: SAM-dependent methyltransferase [Terriglobales bacterium]|nr:SAM-dependent methyltransferase [Terriglobales bacterium]
MAQTENPIRNVSDTALWIALYRAQESARPDRVFDDPFAGRLAGERGAAIAAATPFMTRHSWSIVGRTVVFDRFIADEIAQGADMVVLLAAGLDTRPYRMALPSNLRWVEVDLPGILEYKEEKLAGETPHCHLERVRLDLADAQGRRALFQRLGTEAKRIVVVSEGLIIYLQPEDVDGIARDLAAVPSIATWITDLASPALLKMMMREMGAEVNAANAPFRFAPVEGPAYFRRLGWEAVEVGSPLRTAAKLKRVHELGLRIAAMLPQSFPRNGVRPWSGILRLKPMKER